MGALPVDSDSVGKTEVGEVELLVKNSHLGVSWKDQITVGPLDNSVQF